jgi:hypothetical protein
MAACIPTNITAAPSPVPTLQDIFVDLPLADVSIRLYHLSDWNLYYDAQHIVLTEEVTPLNHQGDLKGIVMHLWLADAMPEMKIVDALNVILEDFGVGDDSLISTPQAFVWSNHEAAYYLLNTDAHNLALVLAIRIPDSDHMLAVNMSAPRAEYARMRQLLPALFSGFAVNHQVLDHADLDHIPLAVSARDS